MRDGSLISRATSTPSPSSSSFHRDPFSFSSLPSSWNLIFLWKVFGKSLVRLIAISWFLIRFILFLVFDKWCTFFFFFCLIMIIVADVWSTRQTYNYMRLLIIFVYLVFLSGEWLTCTTCLIVLFHLFNKWLAYITR